MNDTPSQPKSRLPPRRLPPPSSPDLFDLFPEAGGKAPLQPVATPGADLKQTETASNGQAVRQDGAQEQQAGGKEDVKGDEVDLPDYDDEAAESTPASVLSPPQPASDKVKELVDALDALKLKTTEIEAELAALRLGEVGEKVDKGKGKQVACEEDDVIILDSGRQSPWFPSSSPPASSAPWYPGKPVSSLAEVRSSSGWIAGGDDWGVPNVDGAGTGRSTTPRPLQGPSRAMPTWDPPQQLVFPPVHSLSGSPTLPAPDSSAPAAAGPSSESAYTNSNTWNDFQDTKNFFAGADVESIIAYQQHLEARLAQKEAEVPAQVDALLARNKALEKLYDQALADKAAAECALEDEKEVAARKVRRVEERAAARVEAKEKEIETLKYRLQNGLYKEEQPAGELATNSGFSSYAYLDSDTSTCGFSSASSADEKRDSSAEPSCADGSEAMDDVDADLFDDEGMSWAGTEDEL